MTRIATLHEEWMREPAYREAYDRLGAEFERFRSLIEARDDPRLARVEPARRSENEDE